MYKDFKLSLQQANHCCLFLDMYITKALHNIWILSSYSNDLRSTLWTYISNMNLQDILLEAVCKLHLKDLENISCESYQR